MSNAKSQPTWAQNEPRSQLWGELLKASAVFPPPEGAHPLSGGGHGLLPPGTGQSPGTRACGAWQLPVSLVFAPLVTVGVSEGIRQNKKRLARCPDLGGETPWRVQHFVTRVGDSIVTSLVRVKWWEALQRNAVFVTGVNGDEHGGVVAQVSLSLKQ